MLVAAPGSRELAVTLFAPLRDQLKPDRVSEWVQLNRRGSATGTFLEGPVLMPNGDLCCVDIPGRPDLAREPAANGRWSARTTAGPTA
jgi:hypothetical protein